MLTTRSAVFAPDTPSRVLRQIQRLNNEELPDLPDLPSELPSFSEDGDSTVAHSPQKAATPQRRPAAAGENHPPSTPYTSTPAPSLYQRTLSTIGPDTVTSQRSANDTTATIGPGGRSLGQHISSVRTGGRSSPTVRVAPVEEDPSFERSVSEIVKARSVEEDMLVLSGGSGAEDEAGVGSFRKRRDRTAELSALPPIQMEQTNTTEDATTDRSDVESDSSAPQTHPLDALGMLDAVTTSPAAQKRPPTPRQTSPPRDIILPETLSPLRAPEPSVSIIASPEIGRNSSPRASPHAQHSYYRDATPSRLSSKSPSTSLTPSGARTPKFDSPLASLDANVVPFTPAANLDAAERRKAHLLGTLRSTAKHTLVRGTPHPLRSARAGSPQAGASDHEQDHTSSSFASDRSSNDLTTFHKANTSLPSGGSAEVGGAIGGARSSRFNGAKLNAYLHSLNTHLTEENQSLAKAVSRVTKDYERVEHENRRLNDTIREFSVAGGITVDISQRRSRTTSIDEEDEDGERSKVELLGDELEGLVKGQRRIRGLQDELDSAVVGQEATERIKDLEEAVEQAQRQLVERDDEVQRLRHEVANGPAGGDDSDDRGSAALKARIDELFAELQQRDGELDAVKKQMEEQETEFADNMKKLEDELCTVMEEQEAKVDRAREELEQKRKEDEALRVEEREKVARLEAERDELERQLLDGSTDAAAEIEEKVHSLRDDVARLEESAKTLRSDVAARDEALERMQEELEVAERRVEELEGAGADSAELDTLRRQLADKDIELQQLDEAFEDSAQQLVQHEETIDSLQKQLDAEQMKSSSLASQLSGLSVPKTKSPLANEAYNSAKDEVIESLEEELDEARKTADDLREKLAAAEAAQRNVEMLEREVEKLKDDKANLEGRNQSLREQSILFTPNKTSDKSWFLRPLPVVLTPKTPGQLLGNLSFGTPGANDTITPDLLRVEELQQLIEDLRVQVNDAHQQVDDKIGRLDAAGSSNLSLARQLSDAEARIAQLEEQLESLLGEGGSLERVKARLAKVHCPDCQVSFDANKAVQLRFDRNGVSFAGAAPNSPKVESLRTTLASVNAKLKELQVENDVLQDKASRSKELAAEKAKAVGQREALQRDLRQARDEIAVLETDLRTERSRLRTLASEQSHAAKAKAVLEARLASAEAELRQVKRELASASSSESVERLRKEKADLILERDDLIRQLTTVNEHSTRVDSELTSSKAGQAAMQAQIERQIADIQTLRDSLATSQTAQRHMQDERSDIMRGVASLQADLKRVREDAISLGLDLAAVRRERDELGARKQGELDELVRVREELMLAKRKVTLLEKRIDEHVCANSTTDSQTLADLRKQHKLEIRGCMKRILQLKEEVTREFGFRSALADQKMYLGSLVDEKQATIDSIVQDVASLMGTPAPPPSRSKPTLRSAALSVIAIHRMRRLAAAWSKQVAVKKTLRERDYPAVRGHAFPSTA
ncbi:hypothetical protein JCM10207_001067 [Rhodosporidiobolus poonsookiae]